MITDTPSRFHSSLDYIDQFYVSDLWVHGRQFTKKSVDDEQ